MSYGQSRYSGGGYPAVGGAYAGGGGGPLAVPGASYVSGPGAAATGGGGDITWRQVAEKVKAVVLQQIDDECRRLSYTTFAAQDAAAVVAERVLVCLRELLATSFKLTVSASVLQKTGAGLHTAQACYWDSVHDGSTTVR
jgi:dynein light chain Tctex-type 1